MSENQNRNNSQNKYRQLPVIKLLKRPRFILTEPFPMLIPVFSTKGFEKYTKLGKMVKGSKNLLTAVKKDSQRKCFLL